MESWMESGLRSSSAKGSGVQNGNYGIMDVRKFDRGEGYASTSDEGYGTLISAGVVEDGVGGGKLDTRGIRGKLEAAQVLDEE